MMAMMMTMMMIQLWLVCTSPALGAANHSVEVRNGQQSPTPHSQLRCCCYYCHELAVGRHLGTPSDGSPRPPHRYRRVTGLPSNSMHGERRAHDGQVRSGELPTQERQLVERKLRRTRVPQGHRPRLPHAILRALQGRSVQAAVQPDQGCEAHHVSNQLVRGQAST